MIFTIQGELPGMNEILAYNRNPYGWNRIKQTHERTVALSIPTGYDLADKTDKPRVISICWYEPNMKRDPDNIMAGQKFILDALVKKKVLWNDSPKYIKSIRHSFEVDRENPRIVVEL